MTTSRLGRGAAELSFVTALSTPAARRREGAFVVEGPRAIQRLLLASRAPGVRYLLVTESFAEKSAGSELGAASERAGVRRFLVGDRVMDRLSDTDTPQGVLAVVDLPDDASGMDGPMRGLARASRLRAVLTEGVSDPGNLGTIIRTAAGFGFDAVLTHGGADPYGPKVVRASAGAFLDLRVGPVKDPAAMLRDCAGRGVRTIASTTRGGIVPEQLRHPHRAIVLLGSEPRGLPDAWVRHASVRVTIPQKREVESLNVAVAGAVILYHLSRGPVRRSR